MFPILSLMRTKRLQSLLTFIALLGVAHASKSPVAGCTAQGWVRAPDLSPDSVVRGDVRVKISAGCPTVETVMLGLRLKERSIIKAIRSREDRNELDSAQLQGGPVDIQQMTPWDFPRSSISNATIQEILATRDLWVVREEERLVFESTQVMKMAGEPPGYLDAVQDFAVLVPSTNFPPALDYSRSVLVMRNNYEVAEVELMYEYFFRVPFANGTTGDISAGVTGFQPLYDHAMTSQRPNSQTTRLRSMRMHGAGRDSGPPVVNYAAQISGLVFTQGSEDQIATVAITRTGPARTFTTPLKIRGCVLTNVSSKWATEYGMDSPRSMHNSHGSILRATPEDFEMVNHGRRPVDGAPFCHAAPDATVSLTMPNSTLDEIQSGDIVTTTSATVTIPIKVDRRHVTDFETYYQILANSLQITLTTPRTKDERVDPDEPSAEVPTWSPKFTDDEEPWVPWEKQRSPWQMPQPGSWATYIGDVPVVVRPVGEVASSQRCHHVPASEDELSQVVLVDEIETNCGGRSLIHYLDEGARGPSFVESSTIHELLAEDAAARNLRAPILAPVVSSPPEGEELVYRYYHRPGKQPIYVGETWVKKVVNRGGQKAI